MAEKVTVHDEYGEVQGWFTVDKAEKFSEGTRWDGNNHISLATGSQWDHEALYRTAGGRWVIYFYSQWQGRADHYRFVDDEQALEWLIKNKEEEEKYSKYFPRGIDEERGPGRPPVGDVVQVRFDPAKIKMLDALARDEETSRAEMIRRLVDAASRAEMIRRLVDAGIRARMEA